MSPPTAPSADVPSWRGPALGLAAAAAILAAMALCLPVNHDEGQYVGPFALAGHPRPFADFTYLQTPLQLWLTWPLAVLTRGWAFLALRLANAALALGELALIYALQRRMGTPQRRALIACGLLLAAYPFEFSSAVARNDALPALLEAAALLAAVMGLERAKGSWLAWTLAGVALGAAASAKISYALPAAGMGLFLLWSAVRRRAGLRDVLSFGLGGAAGLIPSAAAFVSAPDNFIWGVLTYAHAASPDWYRAIGLAGRTQLPVRLGEAVFHLAVGPGLPMLIGVAAAGFERTSRTEAPPPVRLLQALAVAGLLAALLPTPMQRQYFAPMLVPVTVLWGAQDVLQARRWLLVLTLAGLAVGVGRIGYVLGDAALGVASGRPPPAIAMSRQAQWIGRTLRAAGIAGPVATPSPQAVLDSGAVLDPRFSSGAFAYRSADMLTNAELARLHLTSPRTLARDFDARPPAAIVTGYEPPSGRTRRNVDDDFRAYARSRGYRRLVAPDGPGELWIREAGAVTPAAGSPAAQSPSPRRAS